MAILSSFLVFLAFLAVGNAYREARDEEFPFQVSIQSSSGSHLCGGIIIAPKWILTASSCLQHQSSVTVTFGSADSNRPKGVIGSNKIEHQNSLNIGRMKNLALIELKEPIQFSKTAQQAKLQTSRVTLSNTTSLTEWKIRSLEDRTAKLYASDTYFVIPKDCKTMSGLPVILNEDEFCGLSQENEKEPINVGAVVSKGSTVLGILSNKHFISNDPAIYVKISHNEEWIRAVLQSDAQFVNWVNSAPHCAISLTLLGISIIFYISFSLNL